MNAKKAKLKKKIRLTNIFAVDTRQDLGAYVRRVHPSGIINPLQLRFQGQTEHVSKRICLHDWLWKRSFGFVYWAKQFRSKRWSTTSLVTRWDWLSSMYLCSILALETQGIQNLGDLSEWVPLRSMQHCHLARLPRFLEAHCTYYIISSHRFIALPYSRCCCNLPVDSSSVIH